MGADDDPNALAELLWGRREQARRGPKPALDLTRIARTAVALADAEGLEAVAMQRVAAELGFTKMALYRYVGGKSELTAIMIEAAVGDPPDLGPVTGWRPRLEEYARHLSAAWERHPWLPAITAGDRVMGPKETGWSESALTALDGTPLSLRERMDAIVLISGHIRATHRAAVAGTQTWTSGQSRPVMQDLIHRHADRFPRLTEADAEPSFTTTREFGLQAILDGLAKVISGRE
ncbi:TetR/AcrR family transcriptional regulator [Streptomyces sp. 8N114]|uniref:TetR/AcrR family transcriptional regulator n=1 Tax=Streptomyces sp. 8N114 TaxID=3457419 RepID=UPI003FD31605